MVKSIKKLFIEKEFADKNAEREIIAGLYFSAYCDLEDIEEITGLMVHVAPKSEDVLELIRREKEGPAITKIEYKTEEFIEVEAKLAKKRRETGILLGLLYRCFPNLKGLSLKHLAFIHSAYDKVIKLKAIRDTPVKDETPFIEEDFKGKNAMREIIARLYLNGQCELEDIQKVANHTMPVVLHGNTEITYSTAGYVSFETNFMKEGRQSGILMSLIFRCYPELIRYSARQMSFIHGALDRIIKLNKSCQGDDWKLETAQGL
jgi:hypothetical protein